MKVFSCKASGLWQVVTVAMLIAVGILGMGATSAYAATMVPFRASYSGTVSFAAGPQLPHFNGTGIATHLGQGTNTGYAQITGFTADGCIINDNFETFTAANGDELYVVSHDVACPIADRPGWFHGTGHWAVTGGTGRFSSATGQGTFDGQAYFVEGGQFTFNLTGTIAL